MQRTISIMMGKGSLNHNSRQFHAKNTDPERSHLNVEYCNENVRTVYHELFDAALARYNAKQTRSDRKIDDYYEKISSGKQEKPFYEMIIQIGDKDNMSAEDENGELAKAILDEYYRDFQQRNPYLRVFSAHIHMDEATPHLHIDFVPYTTGSSRGLDTRVSLKKALSAQGFTGGTRQDTEWNQLVQAEKEQLAAVMARHGIEWEQKGTHEKHLSVLEYEKKVRADEVAALDETISEKRNESEALSQRLFSLTECEDTLQHITEAFENDPQYKIPEPQGLITAKSFRAKHVMPVVDRLMNLVKQAVNQAVKALSEVERLTKLNRSLVSERDSAKANELFFSRRVYELERKLEDYKTVRKALGAKQFDEILTNAKKQKSKNKGR